MYSTSGLRITLSTVGETACNGGTEGCCRYYFTINDQECTSPGSIEGVVCTSVSDTVVAPILGMIFTQKAVIDVLSVNYIMSSNE
jgi:hypothetical protein